MNNEWPCTCNDDDGTYYVDGEQVSFSDYLWYIVKHNDWKDHVRSDFPKEKRCEWCQKPNYNVYVAGEMDTSYAV